MRILHVSTRLILGGSQENTVLSCEGQARLGHEVHLAFGPIYGPEGSMLRRVEAFRTRDGRGITTHEIPHLVRQVSPIADARAYRELKALVRRVRPDIVHTHSSKAGILGRAAAWAVGREPGKTGLETRQHRAGRESGPTLESGPTIGIVHTIHGPPFMPVEGSPIRRLKTRTLNRAYELSERLAARRGHLIVSVADAMTADFLRRGIGRPEQYVTVRSGIDTAPYLALSADTRSRIRRELGLAEDDFVVGTIARLAEHKGHDDLLDALAEDLKRHPHWKLLWIGDGWWRERLVARASGLGIAVHELDRAASPSHRLTVSPPQIILTGLVPPERIPELTAAMDVLAHPSYREGLPRTVPQSLLCGVAPVAYDADGTREICRDGGTGRLVPVGNRAALREAVVWMADHPAERAALAAHGRELCLAEFSAERMVADLERIYERALAEARRVP